MIQRHSNIDQPGELVKTALAIALCFIAAPAFAQTATLTIDASKTENHVSPRMYAAFVEMMAEDVKWGMTAEMIHDRSFEEPVDYLGIPAAWRLEPDTRNDNGGTIQFAATTDAAYPKMNQATGKPEHALRLNLNSASFTDDRIGFSQGRISIQKDTAYHGYVWAKLPEKNAYNGEIYVALEEDNTDGETYARATLAQVSGDWQKYSFTLTPTKTDRFAKLSFLFKGKGTLFIDQVSLEPAQAMTEVRPDSEAMIAALHPSFMRWPGGNVAQDYHWQWGIGPRDRRPTWVNTAWSNAPEPDDLGTDEYLALCARLHIEPSITVNVNGAGATPEEAANWVEYVNGPATSKFGAMRAANGHPAPYAVKQWELGNEIFGSWVRGHVSAAEYAQAAVIYAKAMHAVDPSIKLIAVGEGIFPGNDEWNSTVLKVAGREINYLAVHDYDEEIHFTDPAQTPSPAALRASMFGRAGDFEANYLHMRDLVHQNAPGRDIKLIVNEWNLFYGVDIIESMEGAVYASRLMNGFERDGDIVDSNCISDLLNGWAGGVIQASRDRIYGTPQYYAVKMYGDHLGTDRLHVELVSPELVPGVKALDAVATRSADGRSLYVKVSNADQGRTVPVAISLSDFAHEEDVTLNLLTSRNPRQRNTFEKPDSVVPTATTIHCKKECVLPMAPDSVAVLTFQSARR